MREFWIENAEVFMPGAKPQRRSLHVRDGRVVAWSEGAAPTGASNHLPVLDAAGLWLLPGLCDLHVHLRDPGLTYKEDIASGTLAAAASGVTAVVCLANTKPVNDSPEVTRYILERAQNCAWARVLPVSAATIGLAGEELAPYYRMQQAGCVAVSDDGNTVPVAGVMRRVLEYAGSLGMPVLPHCEDRSVRAGGVMNAGPVAAGLGLPGNPREAEEIALARDILLARLTGAHLHVQHVTTKGGAAMIRRAKDEGLRITAEVCPHHLFLTDKAVEFLGTHAKMAPPLRTDADVAALRAALADGTIDVLATDHAPHAPHEKDLPFEAAPDGIIGLETLTPLALRLAAENVLPLETLLQRLVSAPRQILGNKDAILAVGSAADFSLLDPGLKWTYRAENGQSKSRNSPFDGWDFTGRTVMTFVAGVCRWNIAARPSAAAFKPSAGIAQLGL